MNTLLQVQNLTKTYHDGVTEFVAIRQVDLSLQAGAFAALSGPSGCGKTTLLNIIGCIEVPDGGTVSFEGQTVPFEKMAVLDTFRRENVGLVFQDFNLISVLTAYENVEVPLLYNSQVSSKERQQRVTELLTAVGLSEHIHKYPRALSGGQCQRVAVARAMVNHPKLVLADEPTANLDSQSAQDVMQLMQALNEQHGTAFLIATHDPRVMEQFDQNYAMLEGQIQS
jgi:putative ABC transport system ATP-binding protein